MLLIPMDMPKNCDRCPFFDDSTQLLTCNLTLEFDVYPEKTQSQRMKDCPLVELPKYGRLIDAAELQREAYDMLFRGHADDRDVAFLNFVLQKVQTVATAAEEEEE